ncbi:polymeric immunoglobulin receptor-like [Mobula birostris]|uniref:polymeric immunoglobulin receptor-like n=1 Tax=Mobula birostris TaxID=1983395 RepID=UPI003B2820DE
MWISILLISFLPVSGALWAKKYVRGDVGRTITIDCCYEAKYRTDTKYWCYGWTPLCSVLVKTNGQHGRSGRVSISDNPEERIVTVTIEDLRSGDRGWYSCGIETTGFDARFNLVLEVNDVLVSAPVLQYPSPANVSCLGGSVSLSCESFQGSLPIQYRWYEQTSSGYPKISDTNELTLHCQSFKHTHQQYYCSASNRLGARSSAMVNVTVFNNREICSYVTEINGNVSGALWAEDKVRGLAQSAITIDCHYSPVYRSHTKYLCRMWDCQCTLLVNTNGTNEQYGRMTIRDNTSLGIFTVTMENLVSNDTGHYRCGITTSGNHPVFDVHLQVFDEPVSAPVLRYLSPANVSRLGSTVSLPFESFQGSLPIQYKWYEVTSSGHPKISDTNELALHCQSFNQRHHQYYCSASTLLGARSIAMVNVTAFNNRKICSYVMEINGTISGALWAEKHVRGVVGRAITIDCLYEEKYRSHTKYWCHGWTRHCSVLVETNGQHGRSGRVSITDNPEQRKFTVTIENLHSGDTGWYSCGIETPGLNTRFNLLLKVNDVFVSVPVLRYLSPANVSCLGGSVSLSCESFQGSLPIQYRWYERTSSVYPKISDTNELTLHCQSFKHTHHQYYCSASNRLGARSSAMVNVTIFNNRDICSYVTEINGTISGALWAEDKVRGVVGRAITIDCHYAPMYRSHTKYLCRMWGHQCTPLVNTNGTNEQYGRMAIRDNTSQGIFTVTMENLVSNDTGHYRWGITTSGNHPVCDVHLQVSDGREYSFTTVSSVSFMIWQVGRWLLFALLMISTSSVMWFTRVTKRREESDPHSMVVQEVK